jgi:Protein of unknown function (DUF3105)
MVGTDAIATIACGLARKARTPAPPRRPIQAPKVRSTPKTSTPEEDRKRLAILVLIAASGLVALAIVVAFLAFGTGGGGGDGGSGESGIAKTMRDAGYTFQSYPAMKNNSNHTDVKSVDQKVTWNSDPPTSGPHYGQWAVWNFYDSPVALTMSTHNLEHGGIVIHYGPRVPQAEVEKLRDFYNDDPNAMLVSPLPSAGDKIVLSAWFFDEAKGQEDDDYRGEGIQAKGTKVDEGAFEAFRDEFRYKGRERIPAENLQPGM